MELKEFTFLNNAAVKRIIENLTKIGYRNLASKINPDAEGYLTKIFDPEDLDGINTRKLLQISSDFDLVSEV